jgi:hypothetical protein
MSVGNDENQRCHAVTTIVADSKDPSKNIPCPARAICGQYRSKWVVLAPVCLARYSTGASTVVQICTIRIVRCERVVSHTIHSFIPDGFIRSSGPSVGTKVVGIIIGPHNLLDFFVQEFQGWYSPRGPEESETAEATSI